VNATSRLGTMLVLVLLLAACVPGSGSAPTRPATPTTASQLRRVIEDGGEISICYRGDSRELEALVRPGCFSSSCTHMDEVDGSVEVEERSSIRFHTHFVLWFDLPGKPCTADCGGGKSLTMRLGDLPAGTYSVWLGESQVGVVGVPQVRPDDPHACLWSYSPPMPTPTPCRHIGCLPR